MSRRSRHQQTKTEAPTKRPVSTADPDKEYTVAVPKRKMSRSNTRHRRSQWKAVAPSLVTCANPACGAKHLPHRACPECGQYGARADRRQVI
jgi:large subunit ribosomal protein L32